MTKNTLKSSHSATFYINLISRIDHKNTNLTILSHCLSKHITLMQNYDFVHQQTQKEFICEWVLIKYNFDNYNAHGY